MKKLILASIAIVIAFLTLSFRQDAAKKPATTKKETTKATTKAPAQKPAAAKQPTAAPAAQQPTNLDPWKANQVIKPADLAKTLNDPNAKKPHIINIGPMGNIKGAVTAGAWESPEGQAKFKAQVVNYKKTDEIVVYCGCCSMANCPNIRGAFKYLVDSGYKNPRVLGIETGLTEDWSGKGYPMK